MNGETVFAEGDSIQASVPDILLVMRFIPADSTPIADALLALRDAGGLTVADCGVLAGLVGVRTLGDLRTVLDRGEVEEKLARKLRKALTG